MYMYVQYFMVRKYTAGRRFFSEGHFVKCLVSLIHRMIKGGMVVAEWVRIPFYF